MSNSTFLQISVISVHDGNSNSQLCQQPRHTSIVFKPLGMPDYFSSSSNHSQIKRSGGPKLYWWRKKKLHCAGSVGLKLSFYHPSLFVRIHDWLATNILRSYGAMV